MSDRFVFPRAVLLVEITRRCAYCNGATSIGLTRKEATGYFGFDCVHCERWNDDELSASDIPEWWPDIQRDN